MVFFCFTMYFVIHQATQNLNYGPIMQSQGHQSMSVGTALFKLWFPVLVFPNRPAVLLKLVFGGRSASLASAAALLS